jgi:hypothetical protein
MAQRLSGVRNGPTLLHALLRPCGSVAELHSNRFVCDSALEGAGFELSVPGYGGPGASRRPLENGQMVPGARLGFDYLPNTTDWYGRWRLTQNPSNDWMIDRAAQQSGGIFTGIASIHGQDQSASGCTRATRTVPD